MPPNHFPAIRRKLLHWYDASRRDLPWRRNADPYAIWIAETMLQQTQVTTVVPYYDRFLKSFPTIGALDRAPLRRVLTLWSGLGYYRRAENLKKSARVLRLKHEGRLPDNYDKLKSLPGIGPYTAAAVMSIAFGRRYAAVDGNVRRVLSRLLRVQATAAIVAAAERLVPEWRPGDFNQALMELGATTCVPRAPACPACPIAQYCRTAASGSRTAEMGLKKATMTRKTVWPLAIIRRQGKILLRRRLSRGILAGLWELPGGELTSHETVTAALRTHLAPVRCDLPKQQKIGEIRHAITDRRITVPLFLCDVEATAPVHLPARRWGWFAPQSVHHYPVSSMTLKALNRLAAYEDHPD